MIESASYGWTEELLDEWKDEHATWKREKQAEESRLRNLRYYSSCAHPSEGWLDNDSTHDRCKNAGFDNLYGWWKSEFEYRDKPEKGSHLIWSGGDDMHEDCGGADRHGLCKKSDDQINKSMDSWYSRNKGPTQPTLPDIILNNVNVGQCCENTINIQDSNAELEDIKQSCDIRAKVVSDAIEGGKDKGVYADPDADPGAGGGIPIWLFLLLGITLILILLSFLL